MAKGWESKAVESQVQDSQAKTLSKGGARLTPSEMDMRRRREVLMLSRSRVERDLQTSQDERYKALLTRALTDIEAQIAALEESVGDKS